VARSITYAGFVGVLTGVRQDLSISLNLRATHNCNKWKMRWHHLLVLLGKRPSIASTLRTSLLCPSNPNLDRCVKILSATPTTPCYLILCDGMKTAVIEEDVDTATIREATDFIVHTNHDISSSAVHSSADLEQLEKLGMKELVEESSTRCEFMEQKWRRYAERYGKEKTVDLGDPARAPNDPA